MKDRNFLKGVFIIAIALIFGIGALRYPIGRVERAGPGFFPLMVSCLLGLLGVIMVIRSRFTDPSPTGFNAKNIAIIMAALASFALLSEYVNMTLGIIALVFVSTFAGTSYSIKRNVYIAGGLLIIAFIFQKGLGLQLPLY